MFTTQRNARRYFTQTPIIALLLLCHAVWAQHPAVHTLGGNALYQEPYFTPNYIVRNKIRSVQAEERIKFPNRPIDSKVNTWYFLYGSKGELKESLRQNTSGNRTDTISSILSYNDNAQLVFRRFKGLFGIEIHSFKYNEKNLLSEETRKYTQFNNPAQQTKFEYTFYNDTTYRKVYVNDEGRPYFEELVRTTQSGLLLEKSEKRTHTGLQKRTQISYNQEQLPTKVVIEEYKPSYIKRVFRYTYTANGRLETEDVFENDIATQHNEFVYTQALLTAYLSRSESNQSIRIVTFKYAFWD
jgi:hypothetical protein